MASTPGPVMELLGRVAYELQLMRPLLPTYLHLLVSAIFPIYTAAHASLVRPSSAAPAKKKKSTNDEEASDDDEPSKNIETLTPSDAILFPILAGCTLAGLYFILQLLKDPAVLNYWLGIYFAGVGFFFATSFFKDALVIFRSVVLPAQYSRNGKIWKASTDDSRFIAEDRSTMITSASPLPGLLSKIPVPAGIGSNLWTLRKIVYAKARLEMKIHKILYLKLPIDVLDVVGAALSLSVVMYHTFIDKPWFLTNLLGFSFCYGSLQFMTPGTSWTGTLLLSALFFYDIYFVFFTPMMVTVATKLDVPIKLLFPRPDGCVMPVGAVEGSAAMEEYLKCIAKKRTMAMLGLGDIVIPGMMLAFALRFDLYLFYQRMNQASTSDDIDTTTSLDKPRYRSATGAWGERLWTSNSLRSQDMKMKQFPKTYFNATVVGYIIGMITTVLVMQVAQHAQPALLYLVPGVLISFWGTAFFKGDLKTLWNFSEVPEESKEKPKEEKNHTNNTINTTESRTNTIEQHPHSDQEETTSASQAEKKSTSTSSKKSESKPGQLIYFAVDLIQQQPQPLPSKETPSFNFSSSSPSSSAINDTTGSRPSRSNDSDEVISTSDMEPRIDTDGEPPRKRGRKA